MKRFHFVSALFVLSLPACGAPAAHESEPGRPVSPSASALPPKTPRPSAIAGETIAAPGAASPFPQHCDLKAKPTEDVCTVHEGLGVFVSVTKGAPDANGTRAEPLADLNDAILRAKQTNKRVYVCAETYRESITVENGVSMFGYFDCDDDWAVVPSRSAQLVAPTSPAVTALDIAAATRLENFEVVAPDGVIAGASSIAMRAVNAGQLEIVNLRLVAGRAADGESGVAPPQLSANPGLDGAAALTPLSQFGCAFSAGCVSRYNANRPAGLGSCSGAAGFDGGAGGLGGRPGVYTRNQYGYVLATRTAENGSPTVGTAETAQGAWPVTAAANGAAGVDGVDGASAISSTSGLTAAGFAPASGTAGTHGKPGQGGGGGRAGAPDAALVTSQSPWYGSSGSGGGAGGCPGLAGSAGQGGGASIALLAYDSPMRIERSELRAGRAGNGGAGTLGSEPTEGGKPGAAIAGDAFTSGGHGGSGGRAGVSGHGAGGPSIAIAQHGGAPTLVATIVAEGLGGSGHLAITANDRSIAASPAGVAKATHMF